MGLFDPVMLDPARRVMFDEVADVVGEERLRSNIDATIHDVLERLYDMDSEELEAAFGMDISDD